MKAPLEVCVERDKNRGGTIGEDTTKEVYNLTYQNNFGTVIDASKSIEDTQKELLEYLPKL